ncbi:hypothetical protein Tco_0272537 [Tanacetum coccineum]
MQIQTPLMTELNTNPNTPYTILEKESDELIKSNVEDFIPIPREFEDNPVVHNESVLPCIVSILEGFIDEPPLKENDDLFDLESKENYWKKILYDALIDDLITEDTVFDPGIHEKSFSPTFVKLTFEDDHYLPITFVIQIFLPYLTYSVDSHFLLSSGSEILTLFLTQASTIYRFSSLKSVAYENPLVIFPFFVSAPKDKGIGESQARDSHKKQRIPQDHEDPCLFSILQSSGF